ncbi:MAG: hypothetical protein OIF47_03705 [Marinibacterium sp.]|nr:hypothetical protein [Marinibacterium sp.]
MSRKDPRRRLILRLTLGQIAQLRRDARGRSLGDAARRQIAQRLADGALPDAVDGAQRGLPVQLPRRLLAGLHARARALGIRPEDLAARLLPGPGPED